MMEDGVICSFVIMKHMMSEGLMRNDLMNCSVMSNNLKSNHRKIMHLMSSCMTIHHKEIRLLNERLGEDLLYDEQPSFERPHLDWLPDASAY